MIATRGAFFSFPKPRKSANFPRMPGNLPDPRPPPGGRRWPAWALLLAVALVYANALTGPFFLDDRESIVDNPAIRELWPLSKALDPPPLDMTFYTRPFINLTMCVNYALGGLKTTGYRVFNVALHLAAVLALYGLVRRTLQGAGWPESEARILSFFSALIWAVHPLNTAAVNYLSQRGELGVGLFFFLTLYGLRRAVARVPSPGAADEGPARLWLVFSFLVCLLGMGSKEAMAATPILAAVYDRLFLSASWKQVFRARGGFYLLLLSTLVWPVSRQLAYSPHVPEQGFIPLAYWRYPLAQAWGLVRMIHLAVWPHPLILDYGTEMPTGVGQVWLHALLVLLALLATGWALKHRPRAGFVGLCFFALLAPSSSFIPVVGQPVAEHRWYAPLAAPVLLAVLGLAEFARARGHAPSGGPSRLFPACMAGWALLLGLATHARNMAYHDEVALWRDTITKRPGNGRAWNNLGFALRAKGRDEEALGAYRKALRLKPTQARTQNNVANTLCSLNRDAESLPYYHEALRLDPTFAPTYVNYGFALSRLNRNEEAVQQLEHALRLDPRMGQAHLNMALALNGLGRVEEAGEHLRAAARLQPDHFQIQNDLGDTLSRLGRPQEALAAYREAVRLNPDFLPAVASLGATLIDLDRKAEAYAFFEQAARRQKNPAGALHDIASRLMLHGYAPAGLALSLKVIEWEPGHPLALNNAAWVMAVSTNAGLRDGARAVEFATRAVEILGDRNPAALATLAAAQAEAGRFAEAVATAQEAAERARASGSADLAARYDERLAGYQQGRPWRE